jgi:cobalt-zinc-cadmium efflux system membrane fusion protein
MRSRLAIISAIAIALIATATIAVYLTRDRWIAHDVPLAESSASPPSGGTSTLGKVIVSEQAQKNLEIVAKPLKVETYWKAISVPGMVVDRPGVSDREIVAPAIGTLSQILHVPGDTVQPGETLFILKLLSDAVQQSETGLYKATQELKIAESQRQRLVAAGQGVAGYRLIEVENEIMLLHTSIEAYRYELSNHGLSDTDINGVTEGRFVAEIPITAPQNAGSENASLVEPASRGFELQKLAVGVGQQVQAGDSLCTLANHEALAIEGRAFRNETPLLERSLKEGWPVEVDFQEEGLVDWPTVESVYPIQHISSVVDPTTRTFSFLLQLTNQFKPVSSNGGEKVIWRFRPGQKVRLRVRVEKLDNVFVLPADAVVRDGAEAYVFTQNVNTFERKSIHLVHQDRDFAVVANDGTLQTYAKGHETITLAAVVRGAAPQLNRMMRTGSAAVPKGYHIHADGSLHKNEDEGK